jgi:hypothetical protein
VWISFRGITIYQVYIIVTIFCAVMGQWQRRHGSSRWWASLILDAISTIQEGPNSSHTSEEAPHCWHGSSRWWASLILDGTSTIQEGPNSSHTSEEAPHCCILSMRCMLCQWVIISISRCITIIRSVGLYVIVTSCWQFWNSVVRPSVTCVSERSSCLGPYFTIMPPPLGHAVA